MVATNRSAYAAGYIANLVEYRGHFGVDRRRLTTGTNAATRVNAVRVPAPQFRSAFASISYRDNPGRAHSLFVDVFNRPYAAGNNDVGQLCQGNTLNLDIPTRIILPNDEVAVNAALGDSFTLILSSTGTLYGCGSNEFGQLGLGDVQSVSRPTEIPLNSVRTIAAGRDHSLVLLSDGSVLPATLFRDDLYHERR